MTRNEYNAKAAAFLAEVIDVCRKHGLSISHEDGHGAFKVEPFNERDAEWLSEASVEPPKRPLFPLAAAATTDEARMTMVAALGLDVFGPLSIYSLWSAADSGAVDCASAFSEEGPPAYEDTGRDNIRAMRAAYLRGWEEQAKFQAHT